MTTNYWIEAARNSLWMDCLAIAKESHSPFGEAGHKLIAAGYYKQVCGGDGGPLDHWSQPSEGWEARCNSGWDCPSDEVMDLLERRQQKKFTEVQS